MIFYGIYVFFQKKKKSTIKMTGACISISFLDFFYR